MGRKWAKWSWCGVMLLVLASCKSTEPNLRPPPHPDEYTVPPQDDARFSSPIAYPKDTLNPDKKKPNPENLGPNMGAGPSSFGNGASMANPR